jgi:hypothetical protein
LYRRLATAATQSKQPGNQNWAAGNNPFSSLWQTKLRKIKDIEAQKRWMFAPKRLQ